MTFTPSPRSRSRHTVLLALRCLLACHSRLQFHLQLAPFSCQIIPSACLFGCNFKCLPLLPGKFTSASNEFQSKTKNNTMYKYPETAVE